ncbi:MAG: hypothetical protein ACODAD_10210 [Planctomycetota bacterium]
MSLATQRYVDMWAFLGMHLSNLDILQQLKSADDRQFGANMDVCGTISERDPKTGRWEEVCMAGIRSDIWSPDEAELKKTVKALRAQRRERSRQATKKPTRGSNGKGKPEVDKLKAAELTELCASDVEKRRLVTKLFRTTGENIRWAGTIEELTTREVHNSIGSKHPLLSMTAILSG